MYSIGLQVLRAKLRGFQAAGTTIASRISKAQKERKTRLWESKRSLGPHCRYHLVAYGLLRGLEYAQIEKCAPNNRLDPRLVLEIMLAHASWQQKCELNLERVTQLVTPTPAVAVPAVASSPSSEPTVRKHWSVDCPRRPLEKRA